MLMVAGPNGSGKTTLTALLRKRGFDFGEYINPDEIAEGLIGSYDERTIEAQEMADQRREACIVAKRSFSFETVMSHPSKVEILPRARAAGFFVQVFFVGTDDPQTNVERVRLRVAQGGHDVPEDKIVARWTRTMEQLAEAIRCADRAFVFDNSAVGTVHVPRLVLGCELLQDGNRPACEQYAALPLWVRHYVVSRLGIAAPDA